MKLLHILSCSILSLFANVATSQTYFPVDSSSQVKFVIKNFGIGVDGSFHHLKGTVIFNPDNLKASSFNVTVDASTVNTGNGSRDGHLKKESYFDVAKYPKISFVSSIIEKTNSGYLVTGSFTIKGKSKVVAIPFSAVAKTNGYVFNGQIQINRRDFGVGGSSFILSDNLVLTLNIFATK